VGEENCRSLGYARDDKERAATEGGCVRGKENCRSLGFARDDKKGRVVARKALLLDERVFCQRRGLVSKDAGVGQERAFPSQQQSPFPFETALSSSNSAFLATTLPFLSSRA